MSVRWCLTRAEQANVRTEQTVWVHPSVRHSHVCVCVCVSTSMHANMKPPVVPGAPWCGQGIRAHTRICVYTFAYIYLCSFALFFKFLATSGYYLQALLSSPEPTEGLLPNTANYDTVSIITVIISYL